MERCPSAYDEKIDPNIDIKAEEKDNHKGARKWKGKRWKIKPHIGKNQKKFPKNYKQNAHMHAKSMILLSRDHTKKELGAWNGFSYY